MILKRKQINSLAVALILSVDALCYALQGLGIATFYRIMYFVEILSVGLVALGKIASSTTKISIKQHMLPLLYFIFITVIYVISACVVPNYTYSLDQFIFYFVISVFVICIDFDVENVLAIMTVLSTFMVFAYSSLFAYQWESLNQASMGALYAILIWVVASFCHFIYYRKNKRKLFYIFYIPGAVGLFGILQYGSRGTVLSLATFILVVIFNRTFENGKLMKKNIKKRIMIVIIVIISFILILNFNEIFLYLYDILDNIFSEMPSFFVKTNKMIKLQDIGNGRTDLYKAAIKGILDSPLIGHGIESFSYYTGYVYEHNFILQLLYEGGFFFCIVPLSIVVWCCYKLLFAQVEDKDMIAILIVLFVQVVPRFLVSATIWRYRSFWIFVFFVWVHIKEIGMHKGS